MNSLNVQIAYYSLINDQLKLNNIDKTIKMLKKIKLDPILIYYNNYSKTQKYNVVSLLLSNKLIVPVKEEEMVQGQFKKYGLSYDEINEIKQLEKKLHHDLD